ncbi:MAG TPA: hypothetical protein VN224_13015 [Xanthomonadales bacterium]|nr:hypothetical protein [Xanthomonadales bacterium]
MRRIALNLMSVAVFALGAVAPSPAAADGARDALARHAAYVGRPESMVLAYRVVAKASPSPVPLQASSPEPDFGPAEQTTYRRGLTYHEVDRSEGVSTESGFDGSAYWTSNENRYTVGLFEEAQRRAITMNAVDAGTFDDVQTRSPQTIDGVQYDVVRVTPRGGISADVTIDRTTGAFGQVTYAPDERYGRIVVRILGYTEIAPGVRVPTSYRYGRETTSTLLRGAAIVPKGTYAFSVNLSDGTPEIRVKVGAVTTRATFDTGNDYNVILSDNLTKTGRVVGLVDSTIFFGGVDGIADEPASCYYLHEIAVGPYRYQNSLTCFGSERVFGRDGGLIGFDFLRHFDWTFDYTRSRLILAPNGR